MLVKPVVMDRIIADAADKFALDIELKYNLILIAGDSGTGRTLMFNVLRVHFKDDVRFIFIDGIQNTDIECVRQLNGKLIIIDNADRLLNNEIRNYIVRDTHNQYIIIGRDPSLLAIEMQQIYEVSVTTYALTNPTTIHVIPYL